MAGILCHSVARIAQCPETSSRIQRCFCQHFHTHFTRKVSGSLLPFKPLTCFFQPSSQTTQCVKNLNSKLNLQALVTTQRQFSSLNAPIISKNTLLFGRRSRACFPRWQCWKQFASQGPGQSDRKTTIVIYFCAVGIFMVGASYAGVPLYRIFCQATGLGGQAVKGHDINKVEKMVPISERVLKIRFNADVASSMQWNFRPQQTEVKVVPGETALAFYTARNPTSKPIIGISTYNVVPFEAGQYFNKIQCFCFEEQRLNPHEQVDMPVFFFIDPEFAEDPKCAQIETITLSYTFFEAKEGLELPYPGYASGVYAKSAS